MTLHDNCTHTSHRSTCRDKEELIEGVERQRIYFRCVFALQVGVDTQRHR